MIMVYFFECPIYTNKKHPKLAVRDTYTLKINIVTSFFGTVNIFFLLVSYYIQMKSLHEYAEETWYSWIGLKQ